MNELSGTSRDEIIDGLESLTLDEEHYDDFPSAMWEDKEVIFASLRVGNHASNMFEYIHKSLWRDKEFLMDFLRHAERYSQDDIGGRRITDYMHQSIKNCIQIRPLLDSYIDNLSED